MILSPSDLADLTRRERPAAQARILRRLGIPFKIHPVDGVLLVAKEAVSAALVGVATTDTAPPLEVNFQAIRMRHGTTPQARKA